MTFTEEIGRAKRELAAREHDVQAQLLGDVKAVERGATPSQGEAWSLADAYDRLLKGMKIAGPELVAWAEDLTDEFYREVGTPGIGPTPRECRALVLSTACTISMLWLRRQLELGNRFDELLDQLNAANHLQGRRETLALGHLSAELAARADAWNGNGPEWFPEPPEWLALWTLALEATRGEIDSKEDPFRIDGLTVEEIRTGLDFARECGWQG